MSRPPISHMMLNEDELADEIDAILGYRAMLGDLVLPGGYTMPAVNWPDSTDNIHFQTSVTGMADSGAVTASLWFNLAGTTDAANIYFFVLDAGGNPFLRLFRNTSNQLSVQGYAADGSTLRVSRSTTATYTAVDAWHHLLVMLDSTNASNGVRMFVDGVSVLNTSWNAVGTLGFSAATRASLMGPYGSTAFRMRGYTGDFWVDIGTASIDTTKFRDSDGDPVALGADGRRPFGSQPDFYFGHPSDYTNWQTNRGAVAPGAWTKQGTGSLAEVFF